MNRLCGPHCSMEPLVEAHAPELYAVLCDPAIYEFEGEPPPSLERLAAGLRRRETRRTRDGDTVLDWAVRTPTGELAGYVQAVIDATGAAYLGYEFASRFWRRGIGSGAVDLAMRELARNYQVHRFVAVLKARNHRSAGLLKKLGFGPGTAEDEALYGQEADEITRVKSAEVA